jgi:hypothetical protein
MKTHPLAPSLFKRGGTASLATSYPLSRRERGTRGDFGKSEEISYLILDHKSAEKSGINP